MRKTLGWETIRLTDIQGFTYRVFLPLSTILLLAASLCISAHAQRTVGVQVGDWAEYTVTGTLQGNLTDPFDDAINLLENVTTVRLTVVSIVDTNVTIDTHMYFENGSDTVEPGWIDVDTGNGTHPGWLIAANLDAGDRVYADGQTMFSELTINETIMHEYLGGPVEVNHFMLNVATPPTPFYNMSMLIDWYWYRDSGIVAEMRVYMLAEFNGEPTLVDVSMNLTSVVPEFHISAYLPVFIITTTATTVLLARCKNKALADS